MRNFSRTGGLPASVRKLTLALGATIAMGGATTLSLAEAQQAPPTFSAYPMPGTLTAHAKTSISFRGGDQAALGNVTVKGSRSGDHPGTFRAHSDGLGVSFVPNKAFDENERVTVTTDRNVVNASGGDFASRSVTRPRAHCAPSRRPTSDAAPCSPSAHVPTWTRRRSP